MLRCEWKQKADLGQLTAWPRSYHCTTKPDPVEARAIPLKDAFRLGCLRLWLHVAIL